MFVTQNQTSAFFFKNGRKGGVVKMGLSGWTTGQYRKYFVLVEIGWFNLETLVFVQIVFFFQLISVLNTTKKKGTY